MTKQITTIIEGATLHAELSTDHASSSYGQPVLVFEGAAYGSADEIKFKDSGGWLRAMPAYEVILNAENVTRSSDIKDDLARKFVEISGYRDAFSLPTTGGLEGPRYVANE